MKTNIARHEMEFASKPLLLSVSIRVHLWLIILLGVTLAAAAAADPTNAISFVTDTNQILERTCFQTGAKWSPRTDLRSDVAIAYGIDTNLPARIATWHDHGYRIHVMTGAAWGEYQDYLYGRFDGINHEDEAQMDRDGHKVGHGGDVYYMSPGTNYGKFLCVGVQRALDAGADAIHLEEPEFWDKSGYSGGFKREWQAYYHEDWQNPESSVDARWRAGKLKYFLYRRALQQVFDYVQAYNERTGRHVRCYVPTHSLLNYAQWCIVSPESSLAKIKGCDGYIAQVWTGTSREPNKYRGEVHSRTFETAFLEYGAMQNLVRSTGRSVWYLNDPIEDNANHDWNDYRENWQSTLTASLFQPGVWQYEVAPWPERIFNGRYPRSAAPEDRKGIPDAYATELQLVFNALTDMKQPHVEWDCGTPGIGVMVSDSLMFQRGQPTPSDPWLGNFYGLAMPLVMHGLPATPVQLENVTVAHYLDPFHVLFLSYDGQKPLSPDVHAPLANWVRQGGVLVFCDADADPYLKVRDWWNSDGNTYTTPRQHLFELLGLNDATTPGDFHPVGNGGVIWLRHRPVDFSLNADNAEQIVATAKEAALHANLSWRESNYLLLRRGPYVIASGLDESFDAPAHELHGRFVDIFDNDLKVRTDISITPGTRWFLLDLDQATTGKTHLLASACKAVVQHQMKKRLAFDVEGIEDTPAILLLESPRAPRTITLDGNPLTTFEYSAADKLLWIRFQNQAHSRPLTIDF